MDYENLENGREFVESDGKLYRIVKNVSHFLTYGCPMSGCILVYRPKDNGITFRSGTIPQTTKLLPKHPVMSTDYRICPKCHKEVHDIQMQDIKHCQMNTEIEVCGDCKSDFIKLNDTFFRGLI
jgi:hypothetical protein